MINFHAIAVINPMLCDMAFGANKRVVLNATDNDGLVRDHAGQDQFRAARPTTLHLHLA
jgi:hypothetical protein